MADDQMFSVVISECRLSGEFCCLFTGSQPENHKFQATGASLFEILVALACPRVNCKAPLIWCPGTCQAAALLRYFFFLRVQPYITSILKLFWFDYAISRYTSQYNFNKYNFNQFICTQNCKAFNTGLMNTLINVTTFLSIKVSITKFKINVVMVLKWYFQRNL